jgi:hypothetical protein
LGEQPRVQPAARPTALCALIVLSSPLQVLLDGRISGLLKDGTVPSRVGLLPCFVFLAAEMSSRIEMCSLFRPVPSGNMSW